ncbi:MAG: hypothetical protein FWH05_00410 [Oscillospiraceae bacterium]|nr:hypothetical protein [Oscillospiraceae bacterium]
MFKLRSFFKVGVKRILDKKGASLLFVMATMLFLLVICGSVMTAAISSINYGVGQSDTNRVMALENSIHETIMFSLLADIDDPNTLAHQLSVRLSNGNTSQVELDFDLDSFPDIFDDNRIQLDSIWIAFVGENSINNDSLPALYETVTQHRVCSDDTNCTAIVYCGPHNQMCEYLCSNPDHLLHVCCPPEDCPLEGAPDHICCSSPCLESCNECVITCKYAHVCCPPEDCPEQDEPGHVCCTPACTLLEEHFCEFGCIVICSLDHCCDPDCLDVEVHGHVCCDFDCPFPPHPTLNCVYICEHADEHHNCETEPDGCVNVTDISHQCDNPATCNLATNQTRTFSVSETTLMSPRIPRTMTAISDMTVTVQIVVDGGRRVTSRATYSYTGNTVSDCQKIPGVCIPPPEIGMLRPDGPLDSPYPRCCLNDNVLETDLGLNFTVAGFGEWRLVGYDRV